MCTALVDSETNQVSIRKLRPYILHKKPITDKLKPNEKKHKKHAHTHILPLVASEHLLPVHRYSQQNMSVMATHGLPTRAITPFVIKWRRSPSSHDGTPARYYRARHSHHSRRYATITRLWGKVTRNST